MLLLIVGLIIFLGAHLLPALPVLHAKYQEALGANTFKGIFSLISLIGLAGLIYGYIISDTIFVWNPPSFLVPIAHVLMVLVFPLLVASQIPTGKIKQAVKHPMVLAIKIWAFSHLLVNGDLASIVLFGSFLVYAVVARISLAKRQRAGFIKAPKAIKDYVLIDIIVVVAGISLYALFVVAAHEWLIGVPVS